MYKTSLLTGTATAGAAECNSSLFLLDGNLDLPGDNCRFMGDMGEITQQELQGMITGWQVQGDFRLPLAEVAVVVIIDDRQVKGRHGRIHQQMVMAGILVLNTGRRDPHVPQAEADGDRVGHGRSVSRRDEIQLGIFGRRRSHLGMNGKCAERQDEDYQSIHLRTSSLLWYSVSLSQGRRGDIFLLYGD